MKKRSRILRIAHPCPGLYCSTALKAKEVDQSYSHSVIHSFSQSEWITLILPTPTPTPTLRTRNLLPGIPTAVAAAAAAAAAATTETPPPQAPTN
jgi:hypothetical protein